MGKSMSFLNILYSKEAEYSVLASGLLNNINMLSAYVSDVPLSEVNYLEQASNTYIDDMSIAAVCSHFYACYHYELDELYSNGGKTNLKDIVSNKYFDFSKIIFFHKTSYFKLYFIFLFLSFINNCKISEFSTSFGTLI